MQNLNIPDIDLPRIVIIGAGFAGLKVARKLNKKKFQIVLIDKNNYHQFQPLFYQVAMAGLEPSSIAFPLRKAFQKEENVHIRCAELERIEQSSKRIYTSEGYCTYDKVVLALGAKTNFYGNENFENNAIGIKSVSESLSLRNQILEDFEKALLTEDYDKRQGYIDIVIVGGGATGVELAGSLAEMKKYILPKDYYELNNKEVDIHLIQSSDKLLKGMSEKSSRASERFLKKLGVNVILNTRVTKIENDQVYLNTGKQINAKKVIWAAGIVANEVHGIEGCELGYGKRIKTNECNALPNDESVFIIGDLAQTPQKGYEYGHPQVAQVALQQASRLAKNLNRDKKIPFSYKDKGSMATIGRNKAVVDLPKMHLNGFFAWLIWLFVHLAALIGTKNKFFVFINWLINYATYDQSLRLIIKTNKK